MLGRMRYLLTFLVLAFAASSRAELISTGVGMVRKQVLTSREVQINQFLETMLYDPNPVPKTLTLDSKAFAKAVQDLLLETVIALEAQNFNVMQVGADEVSGAGKKALAGLRRVQGWRDLHVAPQELEGLVRRKLQAKKIVRFRAQSSVLPITDTEAQRYFNENRLKFGNLPFENFKENIKSYLSRTQVDRRLKDWYDLLLNKYQVKNLIAEI
jgi:hypothetical protein